MRLILAGLLVAALVTVFAAAAADFGLVPFLDDLQAWLFAQQRALHRQLTEAVRALSRQDGLVPALGLMSVSFLYGIFHAAGPGHGKAVLATYLLTRRDRLAQGVGLAFAGAFCQGLVAIVIVYGLILTAGQLSRDTNVAVAWSERASFILVIGMGAFLAFNAIRSLMARGPAGHHHHDHHHHGHDSGCGHVHVPDAAQVEKATSLRTRLALILSIGLRPCTGALLVLVFANTLGLTLAGIAGVAAMSFGTGLASAILALVTVYARSWAERLSSSHGRTFAILPAATGILGGLVLVLIGASLLAGSFGSAHPLGI